MSEGWTMTLSHQPVQLPDAAYENAIRHGLPLDFWGRANSYCCPRGIDPGVAWVLMLRQHLDDIDFATVHSLDITGDYGEASLKRLVVTRAFCISNTSGQDDNSLYLVELKDIRHVLRMSAVNKRYNVVKPLPYAPQANYHYYTDSLNGGSRWTWATVWSSLWGMLRPTTYAGTAPTLPYTPTGNPHNLVWQGHSAWHAIGEFLDLIGCDLVYNPTVASNYFSVVRLGTTQQGLSNAIGSASSKLIYNYEPYTDFALAEYPYAINHYFSRPEDLNNLSPVPGVTAPWESRTDNTGLTGAGSDTVTIYRDPAASLFECDGSVANASDLTSRSAEVEANDGNRREVTDQRRRLHYSGVLTNVMPGSEIAEVVWRYYSASGANGGLITEWRQYPMSQRRHNIVSEPVRKIARFELTETLSQGGSADANYITTVSAGLPTASDALDATSCAVTVYDALDVVIDDLDSGDWLWAVWMDDTERWEVLMPWCCGTDSSSSSA